LHRADAGEEVSKLLTHVIILAQGSQQRMGKAIDRPKQMLCLDLPGRPMIIERTIHQLALMDVDHMTVVCAEPLNYHISAGVKADVWRRCKMPCPVDAYELGDPGNSSLKGIARYLEAQGGPTCENPDHWTVVLFGDCVYSWDCLARLVIAPRATGAPYLFVGTRALSASGGELWGVAWSRPAYDFMIARLRSALEYHPKFDDTYQPGQMRRWLQVMPFIAQSDRPGMSWFQQSLSPEMLDAHIRMGTYSCVDDYTKDIDIPPDLLALPGLSASAQRDDMEHGLRW
jgi:MobA-like NTP transferase protein